MSRTEALQSVRSLRPFPTPEGVQVQFELAPVGVRLGAFLLDTLLIYIVSIAISVAAFLTISAGTTVAMSLAMIASFVLRNFYFTLAELHWDGRTIAKKLAGIRVISRDGGPLTARAIIARNLTRDLELFLPLIGFLAPQLILPDAPGWGRLIGTAWLAVFAGLPLLNKDHMRCGDMIGGTLVVRTPKMSLLTDLAHEEIQRFNETVNLKERYRFEKQHLRFYGVKELQTLEEVLRDLEMARNEELLSKVRYNIQRKIGWPLDSPESDAEPFLLAFYKAQRAHLEQEMLFGRRKEQKNS